MESANNGGYDKMQQNVQKIIDNAIPSKDNLSSPDTQDNEVEALSNNKVDVEIEPDVKANRVNIQICSCSLMFNCFSYPSNNK
jgi:hypothetical protein